ncbi:uncharacterized protein Z520_10757 [Fonsecaea multimorphosa CBS 102226]|uniref:Efficient mitochondria targeting-associated protein 19 n=1 Tax=Fonsecaea multimorphosa CBS 102226 TaxID=1442371 RepID=A0A0D2JSW1_9EURO|nr:uncharacterized protein Z520_10757 [Fonsecaea multimorphosa CBS 102226]KIX93579.1 hypothetical protein Z520_10757 [Fonsecaea multimorphosa CBS 102226]OAL18891.1 hypothetical protein AYO22_10220 [Fonsecaea multimorphosa]
MATPPTSAASAATRQAAVAVRRPLSARKLDAVYLVFFVVHVPIMFLVDLASLLPPFLVSPLSHTLRAYQLERFQDQFFVNPPRWFTAYMWIEALYHVPISLWMVWGILNDHPLVPLHLLIFSLEVAVTTLTCVVDISAWAGYTSAQKSDLYGLYVPYLVLACLMGVDAFVRVKRQILRGINPEKGKTL